MKRDKIRRAKKNLVSRNPCKACCECIRSGTSREWEREYLDHKKEQIDKTLSVFWAIYMFIIMAYSTGLSFMMESSCLETPPFEVTPDGLFNDNRSCVVHVLDSLYRAESQLPRFSVVIENCVLELATKCVVLTTQGKGPFKTLIHFSFFFSEKQKKNI